MVGNYRTPGWRLTYVVALLCSASCTSNGVPARLAGTLQLVPPPGHQRPAGEGSYGSARYRAVTPVDYAAPGFAVVYLENAAATSDVARVQIADSAAGARLRPRHAVAGLDGAIVIVNESSAAQVVSCPEASVLESVSPGASIRIHPKQAGRHSLYLPNSRVGTSVIFVSPGPYAQVDRGGHWELPAAPAGRWILKTWHPRFPSFEREVDIHNDREGFVELRIGTRAAVGDPQ